MCCVYLKWHQSCLWGRPEWFQTALNILLESQAFQRWVIHGCIPSFSHSTYWVLEQHGLHQNPKSMFQTKRRRDFINLRLWPAPLHQSVHQDPIHYGRGQVLVLQASRRTHASSNPGKLGHQDWSPRFIRHVKHVVGILHPSVRLSPPPLAPPPPCACCCRPPLFRILVYLSSQAVHPPRSLFRTCDSRPNFPFPRSS